MCSIACKRERGSDCIAFAFDGENETCELGDIQECTVVFDSDAGDMKRVAMISDAFETKTGNSFR